MACNLKPNVGYGTDACKENFSGVGGEAWIFLKDDLAAAPAYSEDSNSFTASSFAFKNGKGAYRIKLKKQVNSVTWSNNPNSGGYTVTATFIVADDMDNMSFNGRTLNNLGGDWGVMIPKSTVDGSEEYYVVYNHQFGLSTFTVEGTTGDAPDSDHGHTYTVAATMYYGPTTWAGSLDSATGTTSAVLSVNSNNESMGSTSVSPVKDSYAYGDTVTLTATAKTGYSFVKWDDGDTSATRTIEVTRGNTSFVAIFQATE